MNRMFDPDSWFMQLLGRFSNLVILNFLFLFTCIPIFTIGASLTSLYDVVLRMATERETPTVSTYFRSFRANFRQSTQVFLIMAPLIAVSCVNLAISSRISGLPGQALFVVSILILVHSIFVWSYAFPLISQFENTTGNTLKNALLLSIAHLPRSLIMAVINCFPWMLMIMNLYAFIRFGFLWFVLYFAAAAYLDSRVLMKVLDPLREKESSAK